MTIALAVPATGSATALRRRPWRADDLPALLAAHRDPLLRRWLVTSLADETDARRWLEAQADGWASATRFSFAVVADDDDSAPLGHVVVKVATAGVAEVGYWTAAAARGQGIAARALDAVSRWAFGTQDLTRLDLLHATGNRASCRVAEKSGYPLRDLLPAAPPAFPDTGHRHVRTPPADRASAPTIAAMEARRFTATVSLEERGRVVVPVPFDPDQAWGAKARHHVTGTVADVRYRGVVDTSDTGRRIVLPTAWLRDNHVAPDDRVEVVLSPEGPQRADLAEDFAAALDAAPAAGAFFDSLAQFYRRAYLRWIDGTTRRPELRAARIAEVVDLLTAGVKQRPKP